MHPTITSQIAAQRIAEWHQQAARLVARGARVRITLSDLGWSAAGAQVSADMVGNLAATVAIRCRAEPGDLWPVTHRPRSAWSLSWPSSAAAPAAEGAAAWPAGARYQRTMRRASSAGQPRWTIVAMSGQSTWLAGSSACGPEEDGRQDLLELRR